MTTIAQHQERLELAAKTLEAFLNDPSNNRARDIRAAAKKLAELAERESRPTLVTDEVVERVLSDPTAVHLNMLRGGIAKPSVANIWHLYGEKALLAEAPDHIRAAIAAWNTRAIEATRPTDTTDFER